MSDQPQPNLPGALRRVLSAGDPWFVPRPHCTACEGSGSIQIGTFRGWEWRECWDCQGTGNAQDDPTIDKDISYDE